MRQRRLSAVQLPKKPGRTRAQDEAQEPQTTPGCGRHPSAGSSDHGPRWVHLQPRRSGTERRGTTGMGHIHSELWFQSCEHRAWRHEPQHLHLCSLPERASSRANIHKLFWEHEQHPAASGLPAQQNAGQVLWLDDGKRTRYFLYAWTSNAGMGQGAQVVLGGNLNYTFNKYVTIGSGIFSLPGVRTLEGNFPYWLSVDSRLIADEFMRPSYTSGVRASGILRKGLIYQTMIGNNLSQLGVSAAQLPNYFKTNATALVWMPTTGEFGTGFGDFENHQQMATRLAVISLTARRTSRVSRTLRTRRTPSCDSPTAASFLRRASSDQESSSQMRFTRCSPLMAASSITAMRLRGSSTITGSAISKDSTRRA